MKYETEKIRDLAKVSREYISNLTFKLVKQKTVNYDIKDYPNKGPDGMKKPGEEYKIVNIVKKEFRKLKIPFKVFYEKSERPYLFGYIGKGKKGYRKLLAIAHADTVPSGAEPWTVTKPFQPKKVANLIYGRGTGDNKGQLASLLAAAKILKSIENKINGQIIIGVASDEEVNMCPGLEKIIKNKLVKPTDAIIPDVGGNMLQIVIAEKGRADVMVKSFGKTAHGSHPELGKNAIQAMSSFVSLIANYQLKHKMSSLFPEGPTTNIGIIRGGDAPNQVASECELILDIRYLPSQNANSIIAELIKLGNKVKGFKFSFTLRKNSEPFVVPEKSHLVKAIRKHSQAVPVGIGGGTISKIMIANKITSVGWGPGDESVYHSADEFVDIIELVKFAEIFSTFCMDFCNRRIG